MARAWSIEFEGALYHVVSRGNDRLDIFFNDDDRRLFLDTMGEMAQRFEMERRLPSGGKRSGFYARCKTSKTDMRPTGSRLSGDTIVHLRSPGSDRLRVSR
jgi:hypothetical protein